MMRIRNYLVISILVLVLSGCTSDMIEKWELLIKKYELEDKIDIPDIDSWKISPISTPRPIGFQ